MRKLGIHIYHCTYFTSMGWWFVESFLDNSLKFINPKHSHHNQWWWYNTTLYGDIVVVLYHCSIVLICIYYSVVLYIINSLSHFIFSTHMYMPLSTTFDIVVLSILGYTKRFTRFNTMLKHVAGPTPHKVQYLSQTCCGSHTLLKHFAPWFSDN